MFLKNKKTGLKNDVKCHWTKDEIGTNRRNKEKSAGGKAQIPRIPGRPKNTDLSY